MIRPMRLRGAAALIAAGVAGDRALGPTLSSPSATATTSRTSPTAVTATPGAATTGTALDALTERAFAVASPCVVDVDSLGVGSGSGVIYDGSGDIVANAHVVANVQTRRVTECPPLEAQAQELERRERRSLYQL